MSKRLDLIASLSRGYNTIVDIGCDHGLALIKAIKEYEVKQAYAVDINEEPLERAKMNVKKYGLSSQVSFLLSDGFKNVNFSFDLAIISGMGGILISKILEEGKAKLNNSSLVLAPQGDSYLVRIFLKDNGYKITKEYALEENNKFYEIILATKGKESYDYFDLMFGPILRLEKPQAFLKHYQKLFSIKEEAYKKSKDLNVLKDVYLLSYLLEAKVNKVFYYKTNFYNELFIDDKKRDLIIIFPGGGYNHTSNREAENIGLKFNTLGFHSIVFHYRETLDSYKTLFPSVVNAIIKISKDARVGSIYLNGFSAGGHLALHLANKIKEYDLPLFKGLILCYPVVSSKKECIHEGSFNSLLGEDIALKDKFSEENNVNSLTPKLFIWHTVTDQSVPVLNSIYLVLAYKKLGLNFEAHFYPKGRHGLSLATPDSVQNKEDVSNHVATWFNLLKEWFNE